jgi:hypothetical protein
MDQPNKGFTGNRQHPVNLTASSIAGVEAGRVLRSASGESVALAHHRAPRSIGTRPDGDAFCRGRPATATSPALV